MREQQGYLHLLQAEEISFFDDKTVCNVASSKTKLLRLWVWKDLTHFFALNYVPG